MSSSKKSTTETDLSGSSICNLDQFHTFHLKEELLKSAKTKMEEVREENERLKKILVKMVEDYETLEKKVSATTRSHQSVESTVSEKTQEKADEHDSQENSEMVSLSLGSWISNSKKYEDTRKRVSNGGLDLGFDCKFERKSGVSELMKNSTLDNKRKEEMKEEVNSSEKGNSRSKDGEEESLHPPQIKKTRVCIRSRCDTPTMNDGCQWRKYGQKIAKGNPCPRAYYRCTVSPSCPVRKQVQRCPNDISILITTYEGTHNHPLPLSATTMASATNAAAAMLKTTSLASSQQTSFVGPTLNSSLNLLTSNLITSFNHNPRLSITNPSIISASHNSHPTITLDLTAQNNSSSSPSPSLISSKNSSNFFNFSSSSSSSLDFTRKPSIASWGNNGYLNYSGNSNNISAVNIYQNPINETIAAVATKAIASNPNFQSALAAAISSYVGNASTTGISSSNGSLSLFPVITSKNNYSSQDKRENT